MDQFDQPRHVGPARKRVHLYVERFIALAREGSEGDDDEQAPRIDTADHVTLDVRDLRALVEEPSTAELEEEDAVEIVGRILATAAEVGDIEEYDRCPGVPVFDVLVEGDQWIQITASPAGDAYRRQTGHPPAAGPAPAPPPGEDVERLPPPSTLPGLGWLADPGQVAMRASFAMVADPPPAGETEEGERCVPHPDPIGPEPS